jgi:hypothetical protein
LTRAKEKEVDSQQSGGSVNLMKDTRKSSFVRASESEGVIVIDKLLGDPHKGWLRLMAYIFNGEEYAYVLEAINVKDEEEARAKLYGARPAEATQQLFLKEVFLDTRRPH